MKYLSYKRPQASEPTWGILADSLVHDLGPTGLNLAKDLHSAIADGVAPVAVFGMALQPIPKKTSSSCP